MRGFFRRKPVPVVEPKRQPKTLARDVLIGVVAFLCGATALGFCSAGAFILLSQLYNAAAALFIIGGFYAALALLLVLYIVLGGHETARAAHAGTDAAPTVLDGLSSPSAVTGAAKRDPGRSRTGSISVVMLGIVIASLTAARRLTR